MTPKTGQSRLLDVFLDVQRGLLRQGPGSAASTARALALCRGLPPAPDVLDIGCGPGMQSLVIANALPEAQITAIDLQAEYLDQLRLSAAARGLIHRLEIQRQDMAALPYPPQSFDLLWAEGSAYSIGFADALRAWRPLLRPGGYLGVSELVWLTANPEPKVQAFFASEYPAMGDLSAAQTALRDAGYSLIGSFVLPDPDWWDDYYGPLAAKLPALRKRYANDPAGLDVVEATAREIDMRTRYSHAYGYGFLVGRA